MKSILLGKRSKNKHKYKWGESNAKTHLVLTPVVFILAVEHRHFCLIRGKKQQIPQRKKAYRRLFHARAESMTQPLFSSYAEPYRYLGFCAATKDLKGHAVSNVISIKQCLQGRNVGYRFAIHGINHVSDL